MVYCYRKIWLAPKRKAIIVYDPSQLGNIAIKENRWFGLGWRYMDEKGQHITTRPGKHPALVAVSENQLKGWQNLYARRCFYHPSWRYR